MRKLLLILILLMAISGIGLLSNSGIAADIYARRVFPVFSDQLSCSENQIFYQMVSHKLYVCKDTGPEEVGISGGGISSLNGLGATTQTFDIGTSGTDFNIVSSGAIHTFNIPTANAGNRGLLASSDWSVFNSKQNNLGLISKSGAGTVAIGASLSSLAINDCLKYNGSAWINFPCPSGGGGGSGTVTNFSVSNSSTVITAGVINATTTPTLILADAAQLSNTFLAGATTGLTASPTFRAIVSADLPTQLNISRIINLTTNGFVKTSGSNGSLSVDTNNYVAGPGSATDNAIARYDLGTGSLIQNSSVFIDDSGNVGIGLSVPTSALNISSNNSGSVGGLTIDQYNATPGASILFRGARGTSGAPTALQTGDDLGRLLFRGYGATGFGSVSPAGIFAVAQENFTDTANGTYLNFYTTPNGSITRSEQARLNADGLDVANHAAIGATASINQITGLSGVGPTLLNIRETLTGFGVSDTKVQGLLSYYIINPNNAEPSIMEIYGSRGIAEVFLGNNQVFAGEVTGNNGIAIYSGTNSIHNLTGDWADAQFSGTGIGDAVTGSLGTARISSTGGTLGAGWGGRFEFQNFGTKTVTSARGSTSSISNTSTGTLTNASTIQAATPVNSGGGFIGTLIGVDIRDHSGLAGVTTNYNLWSRGVNSNNYYEGHLGIGTNNTTGSLNITGTYNAVAFSAPSTVAVAGTPTAGGSCTVGTHSYKVTFVTAGDNQQTTPNSASNIITCVGGTGQTVPITSIPTGPLGIIARKLYRTVSGNGGSYLLLTTINDNTTTGFSDTIADGSLGAAAPVSNTSAVANFQTGGNSGLVIDSSGNSTVYGRFLADPQRFISSANGNLPYAAIGYYGNPSNGGGISQGLHISARFNETLPGDGTVGGWITTYFSTDNTSGRGAVYGLWTNDSVLQLLSVASGGNITVGRAYEIEVGTSIDTISDPFGPLTGSLARLNGIELLSISGHPFKPNAAIGIWAPDTNGTNWWKHGLYISRIFSKGIEFEKRSDDGIEPFQTCIICLTGTLSSPYLVKGGNKAGAPAGACTTGSLYTRTDGTAGATLYVCENSAWVAK